MEVGMRWSWMVLLWAACKDETTKDTDSGTTPTDSDTTSPIDSETTDTDTEPTVPDPSAVRVVNTSEAFGDAYFFACPQPKGKEPNEVPPLVSVDALTATSYAEMPSGASSIGATWFGEPVDCDAALALDLEPNAMYTLWVGGTHDAPLLGYALDDDDGIPPNQTRFALHHTAVGLAQVDVIVDKVSTTVKFGADLLIERSTDPFTLAIDVDADAVVDWTFSLPQTGEQTFVPLFLAFQGADLGMIGLRPNGTYSVVPGTPAKGATTP